MGFLDHEGVVALAHRGFSPQGLENSMAAFEAAVGLGCHYVETDVHATADGVLVAFHDQVLDRVTDRTGTIAALPWDTVRQARIGGAEPIPLFADLLERWPDLRVNVDVKAAAAIGPTIETIERFAAHDRVCIASFSDARRRAVLDGLSRPTATSAGIGTMARFVAAGQWGTGAARRVLAGVDCLQVPERYGRLRVLTRRAVAQAHAAGVPVHVWTVNDRADMERLLDLGVDGIVTDRVDLLGEVLAARGQGL
ncbi:MAG: glycerophosphodiester phosphodiesterase [Cellulomonadaceae bacterium]